MTPSSVVTLVAMDLPASPLVVTHISKFGCHRGIFCNLIGHSACAFYRQLLYVSGCCRIDYQFAIQISCGYYTAITGEFVDYASIVCVSSLRFTVPPLLRFRLFTKLSAVEFHVALLDKERVILSTVAFSEGALPVLNDITI